MLMPVGLLIVLMMGAVAVDSAIQFQAQRESVADAQSIAHDVVSAVSAEAIRAGEAPTRAAVDQGEAERRVDNVIRARRLTGVVTWHVDGPEVVVVVTRTARLIFSGVVPGATTVVTVRGTARAQLVEHAAVP